MIVFDLSCSGGHRFEGWFGSSDDYARQKEQRLLSCPVCGESGVEKVLSAARLNLGAVEPPKPQPVPAAMEGKDALAIAQVLYSRMLDQLLANTEDVGSRFPEEARRIHYHEAPERSIRGRATREEHDSLIDEGIEVARLPMPESGSWN